jgi:hypothetical protein
MAVSCATGTLTIGIIDIPPFDVVVNTLGFTPKAVIFWWNGLGAASNGSRTTSRSGAGWAVSSTSFCAHGTYDENAAGTSVAKNGFSSTGCVIEISNTGAVAGRADLKSFDAGGFTLEVQASFDGGDLLVHYLAIGGADITNAEIGTFTAAGAAPTNQTVNNSGNFQPDVTLFMLGAQVGSGADACLLFGAAKDSSNEAVYWASANDAATSGATGTYCRADECIVHHPTTPASGMTNRAEFVSHNAGPGGFTINWLERADASVYAYLSIKGGQWAVGNGLTQTDTSTAITLAPSFTPNSLMVVSAGNAATVQDATPGTHFKRSIGAATGASARNVCQTDSRSGNTAMFTHLASRADAIYVNTDPAQTAHTTTGLMDVTSLTSLIMDDADPSQALFFWVAVGDNAGAPTGHPTAKRFGGVEFAGRWNPSSVGRIW